MCWSVVVLSVGTSCAPGTAPQPTYDSYSRVLTRLDLDTNQDGRVDQRTYLNGNMPLRSEMDLDDDGRVDRWEYVTGTGELLIVGSSSRNDGIEDRWTAAAEADGERLLALSSGRSRQIDRWEFYRSTELVRVEEDSNDDGLPDKWEAYEDGRLRHLAFDTSRAAGQPDRRLTYDASGLVERVEVDLDRDGRFELVAPDLSPAGAMRD